MLDLLPYLDFRNNPFNLLGLSIQAGAKEIRHRREDIEAALDTDTPLEGFDRDKFPAVDLAEIKATVAEAFSKLENPEERFLYSVFWFWPLNRGTDDYYLKCATGGNDQGLSWAMSGWKRNESFSRSEWFAASHNLAIADLWLAERHEEELLKRYGRSSDVAQRTLFDNASDGETDEHWKESLSIFAAFSESDLFRNVLERIVDEWKDPRISRNLARRIQEGMPIAFCKLRLRFAERFAASGRFAQASRHMAFLREPHDWAVDVEGMIEDRYSEIHEQTKKVLDDCWTDERSRTGLEGCRTILARTRHSIMIADTILGTDDPRNIAFRDNIANYLRAIIVDYANASGDYRNGLTILEKARTIASTAKVRGWIDNDSSIFKLKDPELRFATIRKGTKDLFDSFSPEQRMNDGANVCKRVIRETHSWLDYVRKTFGWENRRTLEYSDWIAWFLKETICLYGNATKDYRTCVDLLTQVLFIVGSSDFKHQIESEKDRFSNAAISEALNTTIARPQFARHVSIETNNSKPTITPKSIASMQFRQNGASRPVLRAKRNPFTRILNVFETIVLYVVENAVALLVLVLVTLYVGSCIHDGIKQHVAQEKAKQARQIAARKEREQRAAERERQAAEREAERAMWESRRRATPPSGTVTMLVDAECDSGLQIKTKTGANFLVKLVSWHGKKPIETIFVRGGKTVEVAVPSGRYEIRYASGSTWYGDEYLFGPETRCAKADELFSFSKETGYTITLYEVSNGNLPTSGMSLEDF